MPFERNYWRHTTPVRESDLPITSSTCLPVTHCILLHHVRVVSHVLLVACTASTLVASVTIVISCSCRTADGRIRYKVYSRIIDQIYLGPFDDYLRTDLRANILQLFLPPPLHLFFPFAYNRISGDGKHLLFFYIFTCRNRRDPARF